jgi:tRNA pseudouridine38-40 synthase
MERYAIKIAYLGKNYFGFQRQAGNIPTIEGAIIKVLQELKILPKLSIANYAAAGRTDRGVNAIGQVISFNSLKSKLHLEEINSHLPRDIYAWGIAKVPSDFSARRDAKRRIYHYYYPFLDEDIKKMQLGLEKLKGTHDFKKLSKKSDKLPSGKEKSTVLTLEKASVKLLKQNNMLRFVFVSRSFLWNQVRKMVSIILDIGNGLYSPTIIDEVLDVNSNLPKGGIKAIYPVGLVLYNVEYEQITFDKIQKPAILKPSLNKRLKQQKSELLIMQLMARKIL